MARLKTKTQDDNESGLHAWNREAGKPGVRRTTHESKLDEMVMASITPTGADRSARPFSWYFGWLARIVAAS